MEIEEALKIIEENIRPITEVSSVSLEEAGGFICGKDVTAREPIPAFPKSAMDGYAVNSDEVSKADEDHPVSLKVIGTIYAGEYKEISFLPGSAIRVMTGSMIPDGYDAVVKQEQTDYGESIVTIYASVKKHENYCQVGEELREGDLVIPAGTLLGRTQIGLLASLGKNTVTIRRPARVSILSTGSELVFPGKARLPGQIYNSILFMLKSDLREMRFEIPFAINCPDEKESLQNDLENVLAASDLVITTGGVSVGKKDLIPEILTKIGAETLFKRVNMQPGTPTTLSKLEDKLILSLSGNPYAALANFDLYFGQIAAGLMGCDSFKNKSGEAILMDPYEKVNRARRLIRAYTMDGKVYLPVNVHSSSVFGNMEQCNCYVDLPEGKKAKPGDTVKIWKMRH